MNIGILGLGEVGSSLKTIIGTRHTVFTRDLNLDEISGHPLGVAHICIPFGPRFVATTVAFIRETKPRLTVIDSTVKPGTTQNIFAQTKRPIVHSPITGLHNAKTAGQFRHDSNSPLSFSDYIQKTPKLIGPVNEKSWQLAQAHFASVGIETERFSSPLETEMAKVLCTTYYGWNIIFEKWVHRLCKEQGADFDQVYTRYNHYYNQTYKDSLPHVRRPVLTHHQGEIGGHCVIPNATILHQWLSDDFTRFLLEQNQKLAPDKKKQP